VARIGTSSENMLSSNSSELVDMASSQLIKLFAVFLNACDSKIQTVYGNAQLLYDERADIAWLVLLAVPAIDLMDGVNKIHRVCN
jgi:hypothetical protein